MPETWLTEAETEQLADALTAWDGWVAGCLWEGRNRRDILDVVDAPGAWEVWERRIGERWASFVVVSGVEASASHDNVEGAGYYCAVPVK